MKENIQQLVAVSKVALDYLNHPDVKAIPFALSVTNISRALAGAINDVQMDDSKETMTQGQIDSLQEEIKAWVFNRETKREKSMTQKYAFYDALIILLDVLGYADNNIGDMLEETL